METRRVLMTKEGKVFFVSDISKDFHTKHGFVKKDDLKKAEGVVVTNTNNAFYIFTPSFIDVYKRIKRGAQIMMLKDIASIVAETGINRDSKIVDAGSGSGALSLFLANVVKEVVTYEIRKDFADIVKNNIEFLKLKNIKIKNKDINEGIDEKDVDLVTLDLPEPWKAIKSAEKALKVGGFLVSYNPNLTQVKTFIDNINNNKNFIHIKTIENIQRTWVIDDKRLRPENTEVGHTGFLSFVRKVM